MAVFRLRSVVVVVLVLAAGACAGSDDDPVARAETVPLEPSSTSTITVSSTATAEDGGLRVSVSPVTGLRDGQEIEVSVATDGSIAVGAAICLADEIEHELAACDLGTARELERNATTMFVAHRFLATQNAAFDCAVDACVLGVAPIDRSAQVTVPLAFVGDESVPEPRVESLQPERVTHDVPDDLGFRELVTIGMEGPLGPHSPSVAQCVVDDFVHPLADMHAPGVDPDICWNHVSWSPFHAEDVPLDQVDRAEIATLVTSSWDRSDAVGPRRAIDCRVEACELVVSDGVRLLDRIPLDFDPDIAWPGWASGTASPASFRTGDSVVIEATGLRPGIGHVVSQCVNFDRYGVACVPADEGVLVADEAGAGTLEVTPTEEVDGHPCVTCWFWIFDPDVSWEEWPLRVTVDIDHVIDG